MEKILNFGEHVISIYKNIGEQITQVTSCVSSALSQNQKCLYVVDDNTTDQVVKEFKKNNLDLDPFLSSKQFAFLTKEETYLKNGSFNAKKMITAIKNLVKTSLSESFTGVLGLGEMTWALNNKSDNEKLSDYESAINLLKDYKFAAICQYNANKFSPDFLVSIIRTHPQIFINGNYYDNKYFYVSPEYLKNVAKFPSNSYSTIVDIITGG